MSIIEEDLLAPTITKRRVIEVIVVSVLLLSLFGFSTFIYAMILGTQRRDPSQRLEEADSETPIKVLIEPPFDIEDLIEDLDLNLSEIAEELNLDPEDLEELLGDTIEEMYDGSIDDLDLSAFGLAIIALLFSEVEVFRVYDYDNPIEDRQNILWKYECFDEFTGTGWHNSMPQVPNNFFSYDDYYNNYNYLDLIRLKRPLSPNIGQNSFVLGTLFRSGDAATPFLIKESIRAPNMDEDEIFLYKDNLGGTIATLTFSSENRVNMTYDLFSEILPTNEEINNSAVNAIYTPQSIEDQYVQLPPSLSEYIAINDDFRFHYELLDSIIDQSNDNAFVIANKIRNYLQSNFEVNYEALLDDGPVEGEDVVEWFCEKREGLWSEFASAFCAFSRAFGISSRFVDGFNSRNTTQFPDNEEAKNTYAIKYRNIYNWAEIYIPTSTSGSGYWVQMDILFDSFGEGGNPIRDFDLNVETEFTIYNRYETVNINATLTSNNLPVNDTEIQFYDQGVLLQSDHTDENGIASIQIYLDSSILVGPHIISASYSLITNTTEYILLDNIEVNLLNINPTQVNVSQPVHAINISGNLTDPENRQAVINAFVNFHLFRKGTNIEILGAFSPFGVFTDNNGEFDLNVEVDENVPYGEYEVRTDFNGTWSYYPYFVYNINDSSNILYLNVTREITKSLWFYINNFSVNEYNNPVVSRNAFIELKAIVLNETGGPSQGDTVRFYDFTNNGIEIGSDITNQNGIAIFSYQAGLNALAGPNLLYAKLGNIENYSYFILDDPIIVNLDVGPEPSVINSTTSIGRNFIIHGYLNDSTNQKPIKYGEISVHLFDGTTDLSYYLILNSGSLQLNNMGEFLLNYRASSSTPTKNYTLQIWFNGTFLYSSPNTIHNQHNFYLNTFSNFSDTANGLYQLKVIDPTNITILLFVENHPTTSFYYDGYPPERYNRGEIAHFQVIVLQSGNPVTSGIVTLRDVYSNQVIEPYNFKPSDSGFVQFNISTQLLYAGLHQIEAKYDIYDTINITYIIINETITIGSNISPLPSEFIRNIEAFTVWGNLYDSGNNSRGLRINIRLFNETDDDVSDYFEFETGYQQSMTIRYDGTGYYEFKIDFIKSECPQGRYYIRIDFNGTIDAPGIFLNNYMVHISGIPPLELNITAGTVIMETGYHSKFQSEDPTGWGEGDTLYVYGRLTWDNSTAIAGKFVTITVESIDRIIVYSMNDSVITDAFGNFNGSLNIGPNWPNLRDETRIFVSFHPDDIRNFNPIESFYVIGTETEFT